MKRLALFCAALALASNAVANTCSIRQAGATDQTVYVTFLDATTGVPNAGLAFNSSGIDLEYVRTGATAVDITEATQTTNGAHSDGGFVSVGHGRYRLDLPDAAVAAGVPEVIIQGIITGYILAPCTVALSPPVNLVSTGTDAITATSIAADSIGASEIAADAIAASEIAADAIGASELAANSITSSEVADDSIDAGAIATDAITATEIAASAIAASELATDAIGAAELADASIDEATFATTAGSFRPLGIADQGTAQAATATTIQLRSAAAFGDDTTIGMSVLACGSTQGYCQARNVTDYVSSTDTATVETWTVTPSGTITYYLFGTAPGAAGGGLDAAGVRAAVGLASANLDTQLGAIDDAVDTEVAAILDDTGTSGVQIPNGEIVAATFGAGAIDATAMNVTGSEFTAIPWNASWDAEVESEVDDSIGGGTGTALTAIPWAAAWDAEVQSEANDAIVANLLDRLLLNTYDPASPPGATDSFLEDLVENDAGVTRFTVNALEQAPAGGGGGSTDWTADERTAMRSILGIPVSGTTPDDPTTGIMDTVRDAVGVVDGNVDAILVDTGTTLQAEIDGVQADTEDLQTRVPASLVGGRIDATVDGTGMEAGAVTAIQSGLATAAALDTVDNLIDTEIAAIQAAIAALNNLSAAQVRDLVVEDQGSVSLGCMLAVIGSVVAGDVTTTGGNSTFEDAAGNETRATTNVASAGNRTVTITCPTY